MTRQVATCVGALALAVAGCSDARRDEAERHTEKARQETTEAVRDAVAATRDAVASAKDSETARKAAEAGAAATAVAADLTRAAATAVAGGALTAAIKAALMADRAIDASGIDVDTDETRRVVTLKGRVPSEAERAAAAALARAKAPGYEIDNRLVVGPPQVPQSGVPPN